MATLAWVQHLACYPGSIFRQPKEVVLYRKEFPSKMIRCGFLHREHAPNNEAQQALPKDERLPSANIRGKSVVIFHNESIFHATDDQKTVWSERRGYVTAKKQRIRNHGFQLHR